MNTEPTQVPVEPAVAEAAPVVSPEPVVEVSETQEPTFKQADIDAKKTEWERESQSRKDKELQPLKDEIEKLSKEAGVSKLQTLEEREITTWGDTPEVKEFHQARRALEEREHNTNVLAQQAALTNKTNQAKDLAVKYSIDEKTLLECNSPEEMKVTALELALAKRTEAEVEKAPQAVDSGVQNIPGVDFSKMTPYDAIKWGLEHPKKK